MKFYLQNYNEFKNGVQWHDYFSIIINEFAIVLIRKYQFGLHDGKYNSCWSIQLFGFEML